MKLCIADPPYLPNRSSGQHKRASRWYAGHNNAASWGTRMGAAPADDHPDAALWDDPETHRAMVDRLLAEFDGWAIAMAADSLGHYLQWVPDEARIAVWHRPNAVPGGAAVICSWEPVVYLVPTGRRQHTSRMAVRDVLTANVDPHTGFAGAKPRAWSRWVLDMLGYDQETDTVIDLFAGSGAVAREIAQGVLL